MRASLEALGIRDIADLARAEAATLTQVRGISPARAEAFLAAARATSAPAEPVATDPVPIRGKDKTGAKKDKASKGKGKGKGKKKNKSKDKKAAKSKAKKSKPGKDSGGKKSA
jgi:hypothetical protein